MFNFLKKKLQKSVEDISEKIEKEAKEEVSEETKEEVIEEPEKKSFFAKIKEKFAKKEEDEEGYVEQEIPSKKEPEEIKEEKPEKVEEKKLPINRTQALELIKKYNKDKTDLNHYLESEAIMKALAKRLSEDEETWAMLGLLHDIDWGITKDNIENHLTKAPEILKKAGFSDDFIQDVVSHGYGFDCAGLKDKKRTKKIEHALACSETVTGLIHTYALMRKSIEGMEAKGLKKKFKDKRFAAAVNRDIIKECEEIGLELNEFFELAINAVKEIAEDVDLKGAKEETLEKIKEEAQKEVKPKTEEEVIKEFASGKYVEVKEEIEEKPVEKETPKEEPEEVKEEPTKEKKGFFGKLTEKIITKKINEKQFDSLFWELEVALLENNVAVEVIEKIKEDLKNDLVEKPIVRTKVSSTVTDSLKSSITSLFDIPSLNLIEKTKEKKPFVITFLGVNGSGKTTTIAKIVQLLKKNKLSCVLAASDTFRAAAIEQLQQHADKLDVKIIKHDYGADAAAVAFDAVKYAKSKGIDVVLIDTAGRMHSNVNLMDELKKVIRVAKSDMNIFIGESITGNDCVEQAKKFNEAVGIDAIVLAKADVDEKGGAAISVSYVTKKPILFLGTGQNYDDLIEFDSKKILESLGF